MGLIGLLSDQTERNLNQITTSVAPVIDYAGTPADPVSRLGGCSGSLGDDNGWISKNRKLGPFSRRVAGPRHPLIRYRWIWPGHNLNHPIADQFGS